VATISLLRGTFKKHSSLSQGMLRQPIVAIMGHVDHGKTTLLDKIRGTAIQAKEAGGITQAIGASIIPLRVIQKICGPLLEAIKQQLTLPGLLFIDTPGHAAFTNLRKRGGNLADIAILVIDINEGIKPQTKECIDILKQYKTPFIIAANKIDQMGGWRFSKEFLMQSIAGQQEQVLRDFDTKIYEIVGKLHELGFPADRFDRVDDYTKQIAIVPTAALTGEGVPELLMVLSGLAQKFLEQALHIDAKGPAKGTILEVKEEKGLGKVADVIIYDGTLKVGDTVVLGGMTEPVVTKIKGLFLPAELAEMRDKKSQYTTVKQVTAATGVRIITPSMEGVVAGMPLEAADSNMDEVKKRIQQEIQDVLLETAEQGVIVKADSLGSLEALLRLLSEQDIPVKKASIGLITKKDIADAEANYENTPLLAVVLGFNIQGTELKSDKVKVIVHDVIYQLIDDYEAWKQAEQQKMERGAMDKLAKPCKIKILHGYVFRQSNPAVVGVEVQEGILTPNTPLMNTEGKFLTNVKGIQLEQENIQEAKRNQQVAVSLPRLTVGKQIKEGDVLLSSINEEEFKKYKQYKQYLSTEDKEILKEIARIHREHNPVWGV